MNKTVLSLALLLWCILPTDLLAQSPFPTNDNEYEETYAWRVRQERLYGVYVPKDLGEVFVELTKRSEADGRANFKALSEEQAATLPFFSLGRWMSVNWGFYGGSRLTVYLNQLDLHHPDDMVRFLLVMYHRHLHKTPLDPQPVVEDLKVKRQQEEQERQLQGELLHEEVRPGKVDGGRK